MDTLAPAGSRARRLIEAVGQVAVPLLRRDRVAGRPAEAGDNPFRVGVPQLDPLFSPDGEKAAVRAEGKGTDVGVLVSAWQGGLPGRQIRVGDVPDLRSLFDRGSVLGARYQRQTGAVGAEGQRAGTT